MRKHLIHAQRLQGDILAATDHCDEAVQALAASIRQAEAIATPREVWLGKAALGKVLMRVHRDQEAEVQLTQAAQTSKPWLPIYARHACSTACSTPPRWSISTTR
jgi:hypothetical protein